MSKPTFIKIAAVAAVFLAVSFLLLSKTSALGLVSTGKTSRQVTNILQKFTNAPLQQASGINEKSSSIERNRAYDEMKKVLDIEKKDLKTSHEEEILEFQFGDAALIEKSLQVLTGMISAGEEPERKRIEAISFLSRSLVVADTAEKDFLCRELQEFLLAPIATEMDLGLRKSLAGDRLEIYQALYNYDASCLEEVKDLLEASTLKNLYQFAARRSQNFAKP